MLFAAAVLRMPEQIVRYPATVVLVGLYLSAERQLIVLPKQQHNASATSMAVTDCVCVTLHISREWLHMATCGSLSLAGHTAYPGTCCTSCSAWSCQITAAPCNHNYQSASPPAARSSLGGKMHQAIMTACCPGIKQPTGSAPHLQSQLALH